MDAGRRSQGWWHGTRGRSRTACAGGGLDSKHRCLFAVGEMAKGSSNSLGAKCTELLLSLSQRSGRGEVVQTQPALCSPPPVASSSSGCGFPLIAAWLLMKQSLKPPVPLLLGQFHWNHTPQERITPAAVLEHLPQGRNAAVLTFSRQGKFRPESEFLQGLKSIISSGCRTNL